MKRSRVATSASNGGRCSKRLRQATPENDLDVAAQTAQDTIRDDTTASSLTIDDAKAPEYVKIFPFANRMSALIESNLRETFPWLKTSKISEISEACSHIMHDLVIKQVPDMARAKIRLNIFSLPKKVRDRIYQMVLCDEPEEVCVQSATLPAHGCPGQDWRTAPPGVRYGIEAFQLPALLSASKQVRKEAGVSYFGDRTFVAYALHWTFPFELTPEEELPPDKFGRRDETEIDPQAKIKKHDVFLPLTGWLKRIGPATAGLIKRLAIRLPEVNFPPYSRTPRQYPRKFAPLPRSRYRNVTVGDLGRRANNAKQYLALEQYGVQDSAIQFFNGWPSPTHLDSDTYSDWFIDASRRWKFSRDVDVYEDDVIFIGGETFDEEDWFTGRQKTQRWMEVELA